MNQQQTTTDLADAIRAARLAGKDRELRLFAVACARQVQHLMTESRSIAALDVAERFANGEATPDELASAVKSARAASNSALASAVDTAHASAWAAADAARAAAFATYAAAACAADAACAAVRAATDALPAPAVRAPDAAPWDAADAADAAMRETQAGIFKEIFS